MVAAERDRIAQSLENSRRELLELSTRNRLLSLPRRSKSARVVDVVDEISAEVIRIIVADRKAMTFEPAPERGTGADPEEGLLAQPKDDEVDERGVAKRHRDTRLQTKLTSAALQKRLLSLYRDANLALEEQGVNILYLALGTLLWFEDDNSDVERYAPLVLIPAKLARKAATTKFSISWTEEELAENVSLGEKLRADFGIEMPQFPELMGADGAEVNEELRRYFGEVQVAIGTKARWKVIPDDRGGSDPEPVDRAPC